MDRNARNWRAVHVEDRPPNCAFRGGRPEQSYFPKPAAMGRNSENTIGVLNRHIENRDSRQTGSERRPVKTAILRCEHTDVGSGIDLFGIHRIINERIYRHIRYTVPYGCPGGACRIKICSPPDVLGSWSGCPKLTPVRDQGSILIVRINNDLTDAARRGNWRRDIDEWRCPGN